MNKCPFTYETIQPGILYSEQGLKTLHAQLKNLHIFPYDHAEQMDKVQSYSGKISIQGVQPKLSATLSIKKGEFNLTEVGGTFILKPQTQNYKELPENEDLTMHLAKMFKIQTPWHGLIRAKDNSFLYAVKRFDRLPKGKKLLQEDFAQLMMATRTTKYQANMEKVAGIIEEFCSFPKLELPKLFKLTLFSFVVGNEDMHLKNFSLQTDLKGIVKLSPAYDLVNTTIAMSNPQEEMALELNDKKKGFTRKDFVDYYAVNYLWMKKKQADKLVDELIALAPEFNLMIQKSFLSDIMKKKYHDLLKERIERLK